MNHRFPERRIIKVAYVGPDRKKYSKSSFEDHHELSLTCIILQEAGHALRPSCLQVVDVSPWEISASVRGMDVLPGIRSVSDFPSWS